MNVKHSRINGAMIGNKGEKYILVNLSSVRYEGTEKWVRVVGTADTLNVLVSNYSPRQLAMESLQAFKRVTPSITETIAPS